MIFSKKNSITILTQKKASIPQLVKKIDESYTVIGNDNIIVDLTSLKKLSVNDVIKFLEISNTHRGAKHSFVIVNNKIDINETPEEIIIVPTLQEAFDIVEMEEMERDLGF